MLSLYNTVLLKFILTHNKQYSSMQNRIEEGLGHSLQMVWTRPICNAGCFKMRYGIGWLGWDGPWGCSKMVHWCSGMARGPQILPDLSIAQCQRHKKSKTFQVVNLSVQNVLENCYICDCVSACSKYGTGAWEISWLSCFYTSRPDSRKCAAWQRGMYQEIRLYSAMNIDSVKINTSLNNDERILCTVLYSLAISYISSLKTLCFSVLLA